MYPFPQDFTMFTTLLGGNIETAFFPSIAEAERHFGALVAAHLADHGEIYPADRYAARDVVRVLQVRS